MHCRHQQRALPGREAAQQRATPTDIQPDYTWDASLNPKRSTRCPRLPIPSCRKRPWSAPDCPCRHAPWKAWSRPQHEACIQSGPRLQRRGVKRTTKRRFVENRLICRTAPEGQKPRGAAWMLVAWGSLTRCSKRPTAPRICYPLPASLLPRLLQWRLDAPRRRPIRNAVLEALAAEDGQGAGDEGDSRRRERAH
jgi:hypothetical protein